MSRNRMNWDKARRDDRALHGQPLDEGEWWWIPGGGRCSTCGEYGAPRAYNHTLVTSVCEICVDAMGLVPRKSKRFLLSQSNTPKPTKKKKNRRRPR